jgi:hypothetical protein
VGHKIRPFNREFQWSIVLEQLPSNDRSYKYRDIDWSVSPLIVARQRLGKNVTAETNTHATIEELLHASFSMRHASYQRKVDDQFFPELLVGLLGKRLDMSVFRLKHQWNIFYLHKFFVQFNKKMKDLFSVQAEWQLTNSTEQKSWEGNNLLKESLPRSQEPAANIYPEPNESYLHSNHISLRSVSKSTLPQMSKFPIQFQSFLIIFGLYNGVFHSNDGEVSPCLIPYRTVNASDNWLLVRTLL